MTKRLYDSSFTDKQGWERGKETSETMFYLLDLEKTKNAHEWLTFWGDNCCGYRWHVEGRECAGVYTLEKAQECNLPEHRVRAIPLSVVHRMAQMYDEIGDFKFVRAIPNTADNRKELLANALPVTKEAV